MTKYTVRQQRLCILASLYLSLLLNMRAEATPQTTMTILRAQQKINAVVHQIHATQTELDKQHIKRVNHMSELASIEKKISAHESRLHTLTSNINTTLAKIDTLRKTKHELRVQLKAQQTALAQHVRMRYQLRSPSPMQWILNQDTLSLINRTQVYYAYLAQATERLITTTQTTTHALDTVHTQLNDELHTLEHLNQVLKAEQHALILAKKHQSLAIESLSQSIASHRNALTSYRHNSAQLNALLRTLSTTTSKPMLPNLLLSKLPVQFNHPLKNPSVTIEPLKQGMLFHAPEGETVVAIKPGTVVFSDWLNGYGLLLILDHGHGLMSLYAHNQTLLKTTGNTVASGTPIATVGHTGGLVKNGLYFELRRRGKVIPPRQWMS